MANNIYNLGNVVGLIRSTTPPKLKPYLIWGKILNESAPLTVQLRIYKGTGDPALEANWVPILTAGQSTDVSWVDIQDKPLIAGKLKVEGTKLVLKTENGDEIDAEELVNIINGLPNFDPELWWSNVAKQTNTTNLKALENAFRGIGEKLKNLINDVGNKNSLTTTNKNNLVEAINEINRNIDVIDDTLDNAADKTYSINKIKEEIKNAADSLLGGADNDSNTLKKLSDKIVEIRKEIRKAANSNNAVLYSAQTKTPDEKKTARENIGVPDSIVTYEQNEGVSTIFNGTLSELKQGNYIIGVGSITDLDTTTLGHIGIPVSIISGAKIESNNAVKGFKMLIGSTGIAYKDDGETNWIRLARVGGSENSDEWLAQEVELTADDVTNKSITISYDIDKNKRFDVFCNGILLSPYAASVADDNSKKINFNTTYIPYELEAGDEITIKFIKKK